MLDCRLRSARAQEMMSGLLVVGWTEQEVQARRCIHEDVTAWVTSVQIKEKMESTVEEDAIDNLTIVYHKRSLVFLAVGFDDATC